MEQAEECQELASSVIKSRSNCLLVSFALDSIYDGAGPITDEGRRMELLVEHPGHT